VARLSALPKTRDELVARSEKFVAFEHGLLASQWESRPARS
jgi:hypothetical protein